MASPDRVLRTACALTIAAVLTAACGSTVPLQAQQALAAGAEASTAAASDSGLALGEAPAAGDEGAGAPVPRSGDTVPSPLQAPVAGTSGGAATAPRGAPGGAPPRPSNAATGGQRQPKPQAPAAAAGKLTLGIVVPEGDPARAFGFNTRSEDYARIAGALVEDLNARGGLAGRKVEAAVREASQDDQSQEAQTRQANEICQSLTQDTRSDLVAAAGNTGTFYGIQCYAQARTPILMPGNAIDDHMMAQFAPWLLPPYAQNMTTVAAELPAALRARGVLTKDIGILAFDIPQSKRAVEETLIPAIERNGGNVREKVYMSVAYQDVSAGVSSAVLRFKSLGVDLVLTSFASGGGVPAIFMHEAETQGYRPKYGLSSLDAPIVMDSVANAPAAQLANVVGFGFWPSLDVEQSELAPSRNERRCWDTVNRRLGTSYSNRNFGAGNGMAALDLCELLWQLEAALVPWKGRAYDPARVRAAVEALGTSYTPVSLPASRFAPQRPDGSAVQREFRFDTSGCACFTYRGDWRRVHR